jgi:hypothetical protein
VVHQLDAVFGTHGKQRGAFKTMDQAVSDCAVVFSALAYAGHPDEAGAAEAFRARMSRLSVSDRQAAARERPVPQPYDRLDASLDRLSRAVPSVKDECIDACAHCALADEQVTIHEAEMLRAVSAVLDCPLPPFLPAVKVV